MKSLTESIEEIQEACNAISDNAPEWSPKDFQDQAAHIMTLATEMKNRVETAELLAVSVCQLNPYAGEIGEGRALNLIQQARLVRGKE